MLMGHAHQVGACKDMELVRNEEFSKVRGAAAAAVTLVAAVHALLGGAALMAVIALVVLFQRMDVELTSMLQVSGSPQLIRAAMMLESMKSPEFLKAFAATSGALIAAFACGAAFFASLAIALRANRFESARLRWLPTLALGAYVLLALSRSIGMSYDWVQHFELFDDQAIALLLGHSVDFKVWLPSAFKAEGVVLLASAGGTLFAYRLTRFLDERSPRRRAASTRLVTGSP